LVEVNFDLALANAGVYRTIPRWASDHDPISIEFKIFQCQPTQFVPFWGHGRRKNFSTALCDTLYTVGGTVMAIAENHDGFHTTARYVVECRLQCL